MDQAPAQERLLIAATESFAQNGYHATTTRDIAARAGMSPAAVYVHHDSKESLLFEVSRTGHTVSLDVVRQAATVGSTPTEQLRNTIYDFTLWHTEHTLLARVVQYEFRALSNDHRRTIANLRRQIESVVGDIVVAGVRTGEFKVERIEETTRAILSLGVDVVRWFDPSRSQKGKEIADLYADLALKMVGAQ